MVSKNAFLSWICDSASSWIAGEKLQPLSLIEGLFLAVSCCSAGQAQASSSLHAGILLGFLIKPVSSLSGVFFMSLFGLGFSSFCVWAIFCLFIIDISHFYFLCI